MSGRDADARRRWPALAGLFAALSEAIYNAEREMDLDLSSYSAIKDDAEFEARAVWSILEPAMKAAPDRLFPRGKWATIQAVQARHAERRLTPGPTPANDDGERLRP